MGTEKETGMNKQFPNGAVLNVTQTPCPSCEKAGRKNLGGATPTLREYEGRKFCVGCKYEAATTK
jgi:hypothetical protein